MALQQCPGTESFDTGQGRSVCEHEEEQLDLNVLDRQCVVHKPNICGKLGEFSDKGGRNERKEVTKKQPSTKLMGLRKTCLYH